MPRCCPILLSRGGPATRTVARGSPPGLVRLGLRSLPAGLSCAPLSRSPCQLDGAPGEGRLTEAWPGMSGHARWHNETARKGNHHYGGVRQRLLTPPPVVSRGPHERCCPLVRESCCLSPHHKIRGAGVLEPARGLSWPTRLSGGAAFLERTSRVVRHGSDPGRWVGGGPPRIPGGRAPGPVGLAAKAAPRAV